MFVDDAATRQDVERRLMPAPGFNWLQVGWGGPDEIRTSKCSYCDQPLAEEIVPLLVMREDGWVAEFCEACQRRWWGAGP